VYEIQELVVVLETLFEADQERFVLVLAKVLELVDTPNCGSGRTPVVRSCAGWYWSASARR